MNKIKKCFVWIKDNKEWFIAVVIAILTLLWSVYSQIKDNETKIPTVNESTQTSIQVDGGVQGDIYQNSTIINKQDNTEQEIIMSESKYLEYLKNHVEGEILFNYYGDYEGNGSCEMFALVGEKTNDKAGEETIDTEVEEEKGLYGKIWYVSENGAKEVESEDTRYWTSPQIFTVGGKIFIAFEKAYTTGSQTYIWGVLKGNPYQPNISGKVFGLISVNEYDEIEAIHSTYDAAYDKKLDIGGLDGGIGHTWKKYYFYFNGSTFKEYGGIDISVDDVMKIPKGKKILTEIYKQSYVVDSIYYRSNNVININISKQKHGMKWFNNITLRYIENKWDIVSPEQSGGDYGGGYYLKALIPSTATYPDKFIY